MAVTKISAKATQNFVPIKEVRDGIIVLKNGNLRSLLMASSINLALKSNDEQVAVIGQFQNFINSLDFPIQFFIESRKLDIRPYIAILEKQYASELNDLMKIQIQEYIAFIKDFTERSNVMTKNFFIVIPYDPSLVIRGSITSTLTSLVSTNVSSSVNLSNEQFEQYRTQIEERVSVVEQGLIRTGVRVASLGTEEVIELFYKLFNPGELEKPLQISQRI